MHRILVILALMCAAMAAGYGVFWWIAAGDVERGVARWIEARRDAGYTVTHGAITVSGFPLAWHAVVDAPRIALEAGPGGWDWRGPELVVTLLPWRRDSADIAAPGRHVLSYGPRGLGGTALVEAGAANLRFTAGRADRAETMTIALADATLAEVGEPPLGVGALRLVVEGSERRHARLEVQDVMLPDGAPPGFGRRIERLALTAALTGRLDGRTAPRVALERWCDDGGLVEIDRLTLDWEGLHLAAEGAFALDERLQPVAALSARIQGFRQALDGLVAGEMIGAREAATAKIILSLLEHTPEGERTPHIAVPLTIQDRTLYVGPVRLARVPAIAWGALPSLAPP